MFKININHKSLIRKKSISSVISVILLIVISVIIVAIIMNWSKTTTKDALTSMSRNYDVSSDIDCENSDIRITNFTLNSLTKDFNFTIENKSSLKIGGLIVSILGETYDGNFTKLEGIFDTYLDKGYISNYSNKDSTFSFTTNSDINYFDVNSIDAIIIKSSTCPKKQIKISDFEIINNLVFDLLSNVSTQEIIQNEQLLLNNSFVSNLDDWNVTQTGSSTVTINSLINYSEPNSLKLDIVSSASSNVTQNIIVEPFKKYRLSFKYFSLSGDTNYKLSDLVNNISYSSVNSSWVDGNSYNFVDGTTNTWNQVDLDFIVPFSTNELELFLYYDTNESTTSVYYDDINLNPLFLFNNIDGNNYNVILEYPSTASDNSSYYFDGNSYLELNTGSTLNLLNNNFSSSIWFRKKGSAQGSTDDSFHTLISGINGNNNTKFSLSSDGIYLNFSCNTSSGIKDINSSTFNLDYDTWYNFIVSKEESEVNFYLDGELLNTGTFNYSCLTGSDSLYIGSSSKSILKNLANGCISDPRIYDVVIDSKEISNIYNLTYIKYSDSVQIPCYTDLMLYLDANSMSDVYEDGDKVSLWQDLSESDNNAIQANSTYQPVFVESSIGGLPAIKFSDNIHYYLQTINNSGLSGNDFDLTVIAVFKLNVATKNYSAFISQYQDTIYDCLGIGVFASAGTKLAVDQWHPSGRKGSTVIQLATPYLSSIVIPLWQTASTTSKFYIDGIRETDTTFSSWGVPDLVANPFKIGNWKYSRTDMGFTGEMSELLVFDKDLEDNEREEVENYLKTKYSLD